MESKEIREQIRALGATDQPTAQRSKALELWKEYTGDDAIISNVEYSAAMAAIRGDTTSLKLMSGIPRLDGITEGFWEGNLIVVSGPTKEGKTTLCQTFTQAFTAQGQKCIWFSFDTPGDELIQRFKTPPLFYMPRRNPAEKKLDWIEEKIIEGIAKYGIRVAFIDHLGMLTRATANTQNYATELQSIVMELKQIAIRWRVIIFINHHIKKIQSDSIPMLSDLKDSSGVAQDSDSVIMVWRKKDRDPETKALIPIGNESFCSVLVHRRTGKSGVVQLVHNEDHFVEKALEPRRGETRTIRPEDL